MLNYTVYNQRFYKSITSTVLTINILFFLESHMFVYTHTHTHSDEKLASSQAFLFKVSERYQEKPNTKRGSMTAEVKGRGRDNE